LKPSSRRFERLIPLIQKLTNILDRPQRFSHFSTAQAAQVKKCRKQEADGRRQMAGSRHQEADGRRQAAVL